MCTLILMWFFIFTLCIICAKMLWSWNDKLHFMYVNNVAKEKVVQLMATFLPKCTVFHNIFASIIWVLMIHIQIDVAAYD